MSCLTEEPFNLKISHIMVVSSVLTLISLEYLIDYIFLRSSFLLKTLLFVLILFNLLES